MFTLSTFSPIVNLGPGQPIVFDHMEHMGAEQREEVAAAVGTGALAPILRDRDEESLAAYPEPLHVYDRDDDGLDWREMFRRYAGIVTYHEGPDHLYEADWTSDEWTAINALDPKAPIPALDN